MECFTYLSIFQRDFAEKVMGPGLKYGNLLDFLQQKASAGELGDEKQPVLESEFRDALFTLEEENIVSLVGHKKKPTIRFIA